MHLEGYTDAKNIVFIFRHFQESRNFRQTNTVFCNKILHTKVCRNYQITPIEKILRNKNVNIISVCLWNTVSMKPIHISFYLEKPVVHRSLASKHYWRPHDSSLLSFNEVKIERKKGTTDEDLQNTEGKFKWKFPSTNISWSWLSPISW